MYFSSSKMSPMWNYIVHSLSLDNPANCWPQQKTPFLPLQGLSLLCSLQTAYLLPPPKISLSTPNATLSREKKAFHPAKDQSQQKPFPRWFQSSLFYNFGVFFTLLFQIRCIYLSKIYTLNQNQFKITVYRGLR